MTKEKREKACIRTACSGLSILVCWSWTTTNTRESEEAKLSNAETVDQSSTAPSVLSITFTAIKIVEDLIDSHTSEQNFRQLLAARTWLAGKDEVDSFS
jgi:hypothetical protein